MDKSVDAGLCTNTTTTVKTTASAVSMISQHLALQDSSISVELTLKNVRTLVQAICKQVDKQMAASMFEQLAARRWSIERMETCKNANKTYDNDDLVMEWSAPRQNSNSAPAHRGKERWSCSRVAPRHCRRSPVRRWITRGREWKSWKGRRRPTITC